MRDKPEDDLNSGDSVDGKEKSASLESNDVRDPSGSEESFRIKDQFENLDEISPIMDRNRFDPSGSPAAKASPATPRPVATDLPESTSTKKTIRRPSDFQDFFINLDFIKIMRGVYRKFWIVLSFAFVLMLLFLPASQHLKNNTSYSAKSVIIYTKQNQKQIDEQGSSFVLRPLSETTLVDMLLSPTIIQQLEEFTGFKPLKNSVAFDTQTKSDVVTLIVNDMPDEQTAISAVNMIRRLSRRRMVHCVYIVSNFGPIPFSWNQCD